MKTKCIIVTLCAIALNLLVSSCKKDEKADDPNIIYVSINKTITASVVYGIGDSLDLNNDGKSEFYFLCFKNATSDSLYSFMSAPHALMYIDSTKVYSFLAEIKPLNSSVLPLPFDGSYKWYYTAYLGIKMGSTEYGYAGKGDKYLPVALAGSTATTFRYGWLRVNISADYQTFKIIDGAYSILDNTPIKMGAE